MEVRTKRIICWIVCVIMTVIFVAVDNHINKERTQLSLNIPANMDDAFSVALRNSEFGSDYEFVMTDSNSANIVVSTGKENDSEYMKFAFSPFVIGYDSSTDKYYNQLKKSNVLIPSEFDKKLDEIDFMKVISEVNENGKWSNLGVEGLSTVKVFYPAEDTLYWHDFYDLMLVTVNGGKYPEKAEMENAEEIIQRFLNSNCTEAVSDYSQQISRTGGFTSNAFWILPENECFSLGERVRLIYPTVTVYCNYYVKCDEIGKKVIDTLNVVSNWYGNDFYGKLYYSGYRSKEEPYIYGSDSIKGTIIGARDVYNIAQIPKDTVSEYLGVETPTNATN